MGIYKVPIVGPWAAKVTKISKMVALPCQPQPEIWVLGYFAAVPQLILGLFGPDCTTDLAARFQRGHKRTRKATLNVQEIMPSFNPPTDGYTWYVFKALKLALRAGWYMTVIDSTLDFIVHGTSNAYQFSGCTDPNAGFAHLRMTDRVVALLPPATGTISTWDVVSANKFGADFAAIATPNGYVPSVGFSITQSVNQFLPLPDCSFTVELVESISGDSYGELTPKKTSTGVNTITTFYMAPKIFSMAKTFTIRFTKTFGVFSVSSAMFSAYGGSKFNFNDASCGGKAAKGPL